MGALRNLSERCQKILNLLMYSCDHVSLKEIAQKVGVSRRSVYYDICSINDCLDSYKLRALKIVRGKGILIPEKEKEAIRALDDSEQGNKDYVFLPSERVKIMVCYIIHSKSPVYVEQLMEVCQVSRNTVFNDVRILVQQLHEYNLELTYTPKGGYKIEGDIIHVRALYFLFFDALRSLLDGGMLSFFNRKEIYDYYSQLSRVTTELRMDYVEGNLFSIAALLPIMQDSTDELHFPGLKENKIFSSREFQQVQKFFPELRQEEQIYLTLHLLGSRLSVSTDKIFEDKSDQSIYAIVKTLVTEFEKIACVYFDNRDELERALFIHIRSSLYRLRYGIQLGNPMREDIVREYSNLFNITKTVSQYLERMIGLPITDSEVAYLTLHFGAFLKIAEKKNPKLRILIVCVNGVSTGNMLKHEIERLLPDAEIVGLVSSVNVMQEQDKCDLIISTARIRSMIPVIVVNPVLTNEDRRYILNHSLVQSCWQGGLSDRLFEVVKQYVKSEDYAALKKDILSCLQGSQFANEIEENEHKGILDFLTPDKILITDESMNWMDAVYFAGETLIRDGSILEKYLDAIISQTTYYGTYMFISDSIMLAHAKPQDGVNRLDLSMTIFRKPVFFAENRNAKIILMLSAEDNERHLGIMNDIWQVAQNEKGIDVLANADTAEDVIRVLKDLLK